jgi:hypothetical protein
MFVFVPADVTSPPKTSAGTYTTSHKSHFFTTPGSISMINKFLKNT